jgi:hypothetical protein
MIKEFQCKAEGSWEIRDVNEDRDKKRKNNFEQRIFFRTNEKFPQILLPHILAGKKTKPERMKGKSIPMSFHGVISRHM